jgi:hypothetical protein
MLTLNHQYPVIFLVSHTFHSVIHLVMNRLYSTAFNVSEFKKVIVRSWTKFISSTEAAFAVLMTHPPSMIRISKSQPSC